MENVRLLFVLLPDTYLYQELISTINNVLVNIDEEVLQEYDKDDEGGFSSDFNYKEFEVELYDKSDNKHYMMRSPVCFFLIAVKWTATSSFKEYEDKIILMLQHFGLEWTTIEWGVSNSEEKTYRVLYPSGEVKYESL